jgi:hypothetical protein
MPQDFVALGETNKMKAKFTLALLLGTLMIFASSARGTAIRATTPYGVVPGTSDTVDLGTYWIVPPPPGSGDDLVLQISPTSSDLGDPISVTLDLSSTSFDTNTADYSGASTSDGTFGIITCDSGGTYAGGNLNSLCTPTTNSACDLSGITDGGGVGTITLPGTCDVANETFYFDLESDSGISVTAVTGTPEPGSLALLGIGLIALAVLSMRRLQA